jgi:Leucine-rich repeat (LRR) protein
MFTPEITSPTGGKLPGRRRRIPLSLRMFAAILLLLGAGSAWVFVRDYRQQAAIRAIGTVGGSIVKNPTGPGWLRSFVGDEHLEDVSAVSLYDRAVSDEVLIHLARFERLRDLSLGNTPLTDSGLSHLRGLTSLESLGLDNTLVTDRGIAHLRTLRALRHLSLRGTQVTDVGLSHLAEFPILQVLVLDNTRVTDKGLAPLNDLTSLRYLSLRNTAVTDSGISELKRALPDLKIKR